MLLLAALLFVNCLNARAQTAAEETRLRRFVGEVGETLYFIAWPTATYKTTIFDGVSRVPRGYDAKLRLVGLSAFDGSDLWTELVLEIRDGMLSDLRWGRHNALLFPPGQFMGAALAELNRQFAVAQGSSRSRPTGVNAVCIGNPTEQDIVYKISWPGRDETYTLKSHASRMYWSQGEANLFVVTFDDNFEPGYTPRTVRLTGSTHPSEPSDCDGVASFQFRIQGSTINMVAMN